jgi:hypothetical protein
VPAERRDEAFARIAEHRRPPYDVAWGTKATRSAREALAYHKEERAMKYSYEALAKASQKDLEYAMRAGVTPDMGSLVGFEFKGYNVPFVTQILGFRKFKKGFYLDEGESVESGRISGYNVVVVQNRLDQPWIARPGEDNPKRHSFFKVYKVRQAEVDNLYPHALLLNYGIGGNSLFNPARFLRDYLVQVDPENKDLLLGKAYFALGPARVAPSFFVLERYNEARVQGPLR